MTVDWQATIIGQLEFYWDVHLRPRLDGLTDDEYLWEPVDGCWSVRPGPDGALVADNARPEPDPAPITTIAWRMAHIAFGCFADRAERFFDVPGGDPIPGTAAGAITFLDDAYHRWHDKIAALDRDAFDAPLGERGGPYHADPMGALVVHVNREVMHHGGEIGLMRDLYRARFRASPSQSAPR